MKLTSVRVHGISYLTMYLDLLDKLETIKTQFRLVYFTNDFCFKH